ncbi:MAG: RsmB/NOP family class I SAM-dependent RNA methyltransferase [Roseicyclus sp.]
MTPGARVSAAIEVLDGWRDGMAAEQALTRWARGARYAGSKDRAAVRDHVFDALRCKGSAAALGGGETGRALMIGLTRLKGGSTDDLFTGAGHAPLPLTAQETAGPGAHPDPVADIPDWTRAHFAYLGDQAGEVFAAFQERAPLYVRVNRRKSAPQAAIAALAADGVEACTVPGCDTALMVTGGGRKLRLGAAYLDGLVEPQDLSVQKAMARVPWPRTGRILDYCAGGGGKTLALLDLTDAGVTAHDAEPRRMVDLPNRAARAGVSAAIVETDEVTSLPAYDAVLCDVPCSGSGTWRRDPEAKWRLTPARLAQLIETQATILDAASDLVGPGGMLVYMTCSLFEAENAAQIDGFCNRRPGWRVLGQGTDTPLTASDGFFHAWIQAPGK